MNALLEFVFEILMPELTAEWLEFLFRIREVLGSKNISGFSNLQFLWFS
jgi:hypothetical protein